MFRPTAPALALALALAATLTACGGGHDAHASSTPTPSASRAPSPSPSPSATKAGASAPPKATLPQGFHIVVDGGKTGDPAKDAVLAANLAQYEATYQAVARQDPDDALYKEWTGRSSAVMDAQSDARDYIESFVKVKQTVSGTIRLYDERVTSITAKKADLTWCEDQSKAFSKVIATGKVLYNKPNQNSYIYKQSLLWKNRDGRWITVGITSVQGDARCT
jgi:hypothetical protein